MTRSLSVAIGPYMHVAGLMNGEVQVDGLDLRFVSPGTEQILQGMLTHREWEVAEFSLAQYIAMRSRGDDSLVAIPVFPSRVFRHGSMFVRRGLAVEPRALTGAAVGVPEWPQTAGIWMRGVLADQYGVDLVSVRWVQADVNKPGRRPGAVVTLPDGMSLTVREDASLDALLRRGELDVVLSARPPAGFTDGSGDIVRLIPDHQAAARAWWEQTQIFPIMHVVVLRRDVYEQAPETARGLLDGFTDAKRRAVALLAEETVSTIPLPWIPDLLGELRSAAGGGEWWPYGIAANRVTLDAFLRYCRQQGVAAPDLELETLFAPESR